MRVLLINSNQLKEPIPVLPIGLCYIASTLEENGYTVSFLDLCFSRDTEKDILNRIENFKPDIIGISIRNIDNSVGFNTCFLIEEIKIKTTDICKRHFTGPIVIGGASVGINPEEILEYLDLRYAIYGDGEFALLEFVNRIKNGSSLSGLNGLVIRENGNIIEKNPQYFLPDLNKIPFAKPYKYLDLAKYKLNNSTVQIQTKRGCPLKCSYCSYNSIEGYTYRFRSPQIIKNEIIDLVTNSGIKNIDIVDSIFNIPLNHAKIVLKEIIDSGVKLKSLCMVLNPKYIDEEFVELIKKIDNVEIQIGAESLNDGVLQKMGKDYTQEDIIRAAKLLKQSKIKSVLWFLLLGAEGESYQSVNETFRILGKIVSIGSVVFIGIGLRVYNGSPISKRLKLQNNNITDDNFLLPYTYKPELINLDTISILSNIAFFRYHNFYVISFRAKIPTVISIFSKIFLPNKPVWKIMIFSKFLLKITGISFLISKIIEFINRDKLKKYKKL